MVQFKFHKITSVNKNAMTTANVISLIKYYSNLDNCDSADDMQRALEEINDLLEREFPDIPEAEDGDLD